MQEERLLGGESQTVEYKRSRSDNAKSYLKTVVAFANARGGTVVFGIDDKTHEVLGIPDEKVFADMDAISNAIMNSVVPEIAPNISVQSLDGKSVIMVEVPYGMRCPYYLKSEGLENGIYVRVGATTRHGDAEWGRLLAVEYSELGYDRTVCRGRYAKSSDIDALCESMYRIALSRCSSEDERAVIRKPAKPQLLSWGILKERGHEVLPTNAFFLLLGTAFDMPLLQCAIFKGENRSVFLDRQEFRGGLAEQIEQAFSWVKAKLNLGADFSEPVRKDVYELPLWPIREIITNAVLHRNYLSSGNVQIALYDDRLEISSPGSLPRGITLEQALNGRSECRNKALAQAFRYMKLIEGWRSGLPRAVSDTVAYGLKEPAFVDMGNTIRVNFFRPTSDEFEAILRGHNAVIADRPPITADRPPIAADRPPIAADRMAAIQALFDEHEEISASMVAGVLGLSARRAREILQQLTDAGVLLKRSDRRYARYMLASRQKRQSD